MNFLKIADATSSATWTTMSDSNTHVGFQMVYGVPEKVAESDTCTRIGSRHPTHVPM